ncbi:hypothetical protein D0809_09415 [Flavobacterium circumlabens]|uniref:Uncharacterized protein n=1 Tax=Flavobacterium circumlabens TaxID=2133765 RepID=A0A4Y7UG32_9FLAO|nr:hypothetical protein [Flavobacterium circumlabens]TCN60141.1 hypothetical protein EV142_102761 [Flavobacterium circumlabens]TEB45367.1 hypothetical protein D0809_09415 [Flavobacterium circumlabens]
MFYLRKRKLKRGDVVRAKIAGIPSIHTCIILEDETQNQHTRCLPICNFTGSIIPKGEYSIDISGFDLPESWFGLKKTDTWLRCNEIDCVYSLEIEEPGKIGNICKQFPKLWSHICEAIHSCAISLRLEQACDCDYKLIEKEISLGLKTKPDCGCKK